MIDKGLMSRVEERVDRLRELRDVHGWPEPRTVDDLRGDPRVQLRNQRGGRDENLELAAALILLVADVPLSEGSGSEVEGHE